MGINIKQNARLVNAKLGRETLNKFGANFAISYGLDGFSIVDIQARNVPNDIKDYLEGNDTYETFALPQNIEKLCEYALASFPNITDLYLFCESVVEIEDDLSYLTNLSVIYVPTDLLSAYQTQYASVPNILNKLDVILFDYQLTIPVYDNIGNVLNDQAINYFISGLSQAQKEILTKLVISTDYVDYYSEVWHYNFTEALENLNNNIYYGINKIDMETLNIISNVAHTYENTENQVLNVSADKINGVKKINVVGGTINTSASVNFLDACESLPNVDTVIFNSAILSQYNSNAILYSNWANSNCMFVNVIYNSPTFPGGAFAYTYIKYFESETITQIPYESTFAMSKIEDVKVPNVTVIQYNAFYSCNGFYNKELVFENVEVLKSGAFHESIQGTAKLYLPKVNALDEPFGRINYSKFFFGAGAINFRQQLVGQPSYRPGGAYFKANKLVDFFTNSMLDQWKTYCRYGIIGVIDGADVYTNLKNRGVSMNYPKLSSTLTIDTTNGHLIENNVDLFSGYNATWYTDEECSLEVQPSNINASMTVYVKLTAI